jgi:hypothetical protein
MPPASVPGMAPSQAGEPSATKTCGPMPTTSSARSTLRKLRSSCASSSCIATAKGPRRVTQVLNKGARARAEGAATSPERVGAVVPARDPPRDVGHIANLQGETQTASFGSLEVRRTLRLARKPRRGQVDGVRAWPDIAAFISAIAASSFAVWSKILRLLQKNSRSLEAFSRSLVFSLTTIMTLSRRRTF